MDDGIEGLLKKILVDAYGEDEQLAAFARAFEMSNATVALPNRLRL